jgi:adenylate cyclase
MARLLVTTPQGEKLVELTARTTLGRHPGNSLQLLDKIVSKEHCVIDRRDDGYYLTDLGSLNGTFVNGSRMTGEHRFCTGDEVTLGSIRIRFDDDADSTSVDDSGAGRHSHVAPISHPRDDSVPPEAPAEGAPALSFNDEGRATDPRKGAQPTGEAQVVNDENRSIGEQIAATQRFLPYEDVAGNERQLAGDYERLRLSHEVSREIALERDLDKLLSKVLQSVFRFVAADRGVIFLRDGAGELNAGASLRRDGSDAPIKVSSTIMNHVMKERATVITHDAAMDFAGSHGKSMIVNQISSAIVAPLVHNDEILGVLWLDSASLAQFQAKDMEIVTSIASQAAMFIEINILGHKVEEEIIRRERFSRLLSPNVAERVMTGELEVKKGGQRVRECTVFNSDIRGFTRMSEGSKPEAIVEMLNEYFELMTETVFDHEGTLDKYMGDGLMAVWGAPVLHADDAIRSVECALDQMEALGHYNRKRLGDKLPPLAVGVGIHTGPLVAGYIGSSKALSYTVIGDTANTSARICGRAKAGQILVSESTLKALRNRYEYEELPPAQLKGKSNPFALFNIRSRRKTSGSPERTV